MEYYQADQADSPDATFKSSVEEFTEYYHKNSFYDMQERLVRMYVATHDRRVVGYVTLAMAHLRPDATKEIKEKEVNGNIPALLISHLAVHEDHQRLGIGSKLLDLVFYVVPKLERWSGCRYVVLSPRDDAGVINFYERYGFEYAPNFNDDKYSAACLMDLRSYYSTQVGGT